MNQMNKVPLGVLLTLMSSMAYADVSHEFIWGLGSDSSSKVTVDTVNKVFPALNSSNDLSDSVEESNSILSFSYSYFLSPMVPDTTPFDLTKFYQHPSNFSVGSASISTSSEDRTNPSSITKSDITAVALMLGAEYYLPSNTGFLISIGPGAGELTVTSGGAEAKADVDLEMINIGIRQYAARNAALHLMVSNEETSGDITGSMQGSLKDTKTVTKLGGQMVFHDRVGIMFEVGRGERESSLAAATPDTYDVAEVKTELSFYGGKSFSILLGVDLNGEFQTGMTPGNGHEISESRVRLAPRYWFSENLGMEISLYSITNEELLVTPFTDTTTTTESSGVEFHLGYRF